VLRITIRFTTPTFLPSLLFLRFDDSSHEHAISLILLIGISLYTIACSLSLCHDSYPITFYPIRVNPHLSSWSARRVAPSADVTCPARLVNT